MKNLLIKNLTKLKHRYIVMKTTKKLPETPWGLLIPAIRFMSIQMKANEEAVLTDAVRRRQNS